MAALDFVNADPVVCSNAMSLARQVFEYLGDTPLDGFAIGYDEDDKTAEFIVGRGPVEIRTYYDGSADRYQVKHYENGAVTSTEWQKRPYDIERHFGVLKRNMK